MYNAAGAKIMGYYMEFGYATKDDIKQLTELRIAYIKEDLKTVLDEDVRIMKKNIPLYFENHLNDDCFGFVAKDGKTVAAVALLLVVEKPASPNFINGLTGEVLSVYTRPEYRRQGLCLNLMKLLIESAREMGLDKVQLKATEDGYPVYKKAGFADCAGEYKEMVLKF